MAEKPSWRLVIDTSITSAASLRAGLPDPASRLCRELLETVLRICHRFVWTPELREEWHTHRSRYASTWLKSMYARRKVVSVQPDENRSLQAKILKTAKTESEKRALRKDLLLVEAAVATDSIILSRDHRARELFRRAAIGHAALRSIVWMNPETEQGLLAWLRGDAERPPETTLGMG